MNKVDVFTLLRLVLLAIGFVLVALVYLPRQEPAQHEPVPGISDEAVSSSPPNT